VIKDVLNRVRTIITFHKLSYRLLSFFIRERLLWGIVIYFDLFNSSGVFFNFSFIFFGLFFFLLLFFCSFFLFLFLFFFPLFFIFSRCFRFCRSSFLLGRILLHRFLLAITYSLVIVLFPQFSSWCFLFFLLSWVLLSSWIVLIFVLFSSCSSWFIVHFFVLILNFLGNLRLFLDLENIQWLLLLLRFWAILSKNLLTRLWLLAFSSWHVIRINHNKLIES